MDFSSLDLLGCYTVM